MESIEDSTELVETAWKWHRMKYPSLGERDLAQKVSDSLQRIRERQVREDRLTASIPVCARSFHRYYRGDMDTALSAWRRLPGETHKEKLEVLVEKQREKYIFPLYDELVGLRTEDADDPTYYRLCELFLTVPVMWGNLWIRRTKEQSGFLAYKTYRTAITKSPGSGKPLSRIFLSEYLERPLKRSEGAGFRDGNPFNLSYENVILTTISGRRMTCYSCQRSTTREDSAVIEQKRFCYACLSRFSSG